MRAAAPVARLTAIVLTIWGVVVGAGGAVAKFPYTMGLGGLLLLAALVLAVLAHTERPQR